MSVQSVSELQAQGQGLYAAGDYAGALESFTKLSEQQPTSGDAWRLLGFAQYALQQFEPAKESFTKATVLLPNDPEGFLGFGFALLASGDFDGAVEKLDESLRIRSDNAYTRSALIDALMRRAKKYETEGNHQYAEHDWDRAIKLDRKNSEPVLGLTKHFIDSGQLARAGKTIELALVDMPLDPKIQAAAQQLNVTASNSAVVDSIKREQVRQSQEVPCPVCKKMVAEWASVCPHCQSTIKQAPSRFAAIDRGPKYIWQDIAYKICAVLWIVEGAWEIYQGVQLRQNKFYMPGMEALFMFLGVGHIGVGIGLLLEVEWLMFTAKILAILTILNSGSGAIMSAALGRPIDFVVSLAITLVACLQIYLISFMGD